MVREFQIQSRRAYRFDSSSHLLCLHIPQIISPKIDKREVRSCRTPRIATLRSDTLSRKRSHIQDVGRKRSAILAAGSSSHSVPTHSFTHTRSAGRFASLYTPERSEKRFGWQGRKVRDRRASHTDMSCIVQKRIGAYA